MQLSRSSPSAAQPSSVTVDCWSGPEALRQLDGISLPPVTGFDGHPSDNMRWATAVAAGLGHRPYFLHTSEEDGSSSGLVLMHVSSRIFGSYLVSLPFVSSGGVRAWRKETALRLVDRAIDLADQLKVKHLEFRHEHPIDHPKLTTPPASKVHCRLQLPESEDGVLKQLRAKVRNQVKRGMENDFHVQWGGLELLGGFYQVFSRNMRDLGSPVFGRKLFSSIFEAFGDSAELGLVRHEEEVIAGALLVHDQQVTEVPCASCLRSYNRLNANMFMYWNLLRRAVARGSGIFDFGRSTIDSGTHRFKRQWRPDECQPAWQYYVRHGEIGAIRKESKKFALAVRIWQKLPLSIANLLGPSLARSIP